MIQPLELTISNEAFSYLRIQRGAISDLSNDRKAWEQAYRRSLLGDMGTMLPWLPERCGAILDVGSGLGGINILLSRHYGASLDVWLLDGVNDQAHVSSHDTPFNDMVVAQRFLNANGVRTFSHVPPLESLERKVILRPTFDLAVSLQAWCFHFPPSQYLAFVKQSIKPRATLILDVRKDRKDWREELRDAFTEIGVAVSPHKFERVVFRNDR